MWTPKQEYAPSKSIRDSNLWITWMETAHPMCCYWACNKIILHYQPNSDSFFPPTSFIWHHRQDKSEEIKLRLFLWHDLTSYHLATEAGFWKNVNVAFNAIFQSQFLGYVMIPAILFLWLSILWSLPHWHSCIFYWLVSLLSTDAF